MRNSKRKEIFFHDIIFRNTYYFMMGALHDFCEYKNGLNGALFLLEMWNTWYIFWYIQDRQAWKDTANMQDFPSGLLSYLFKISYDNLTKYDERKKCVSMYSNHYKTDWFGTFTVIWKLLICISILWHNSVAIYSKMFKGYDYISYNI